MKRKSSIQDLATGFAAITMILFLTPVIFAQAASSSTYFLPTGEQSPGGACASTTYRLKASFGAGVVADLSVSANFKLLGGFNAAIEAPAAGRPWLTGVRPLYGPITGSTAPYSLHGTELHLGTATNITIGGHAATVFSRARDHVVVQLPAQPAPGWQAVTATNTGGTAILPEGIGILPMLETAHAVAPNQPFRITYRGAKGDILYLMATGAKLPVAVPLPPYHHGLELNFGAILAFLGPLWVSEPSGEFHLDFPGLPPGPPIYVQILALPTGSPGYGPGSFTNVISI